MSLTDTISTVIAMLKVGMTTGKSEDDEYFVKTWYTGDPLSLPMIEVPAAAVLPTMPISRTFVFVGEDTAKETIYIRFYQSAARRQSEAPEISAAYTKLSAMFTTAQVLLRTDPTFSSTFVYSEIKDVNPLLVGIAGGNAYRIAEIEFEITRRILWGL